MPLNLQPFRSRLRPGALVLATLFVLGLGTLLARRPSAAPEPSRPVCDVPFSNLNSQIYMRGTANQSDSLWVVLDTGASAHVIDESLAVRMRLPLSNPHESHGAGGSQRSHMARDVTTRFGCMEYKDSRIATIPMAPVSAQAGRNLDVILGYPLLSKWVVEVDYAAERLRFHDPKKFNYRGNGASLPLEFIENLPYIEAEIELPGRAPVRGQFVLDTGSSTTLILAPAFVEKTRALETLSRSVETSGRGVGGASSSVAGRIAAITLGGYRLESPTVMFRRPGPGGVSAHGSAGNIGGAILKRFRVYFDYPRKRMILEPNARLGDPFEIDMTGFQLAASPGQSGFRVARVAPDTPAAEAGVAEGDMLVSVDGRPANEIGIAKIRESFRVPDRTYALAFLRGERTIEVRLTTRRIV
ncbi:MAG: aspartyl protease family protein [Candidatus Eiseniibacteriota bacterium]